MPSRLPELPSGEVTPQDDYWARQRVVVVDDATAAALAEARQAAEREKKENFDVLGEAKKRIPALVVHLALGPAAMVATELAVQVVIPAVKRLREQGQVVLPMSYRDSHAFKFPIGHPVPAVVYVADPTDKTAYLPAGDFHRVVAERKCAAAIRMLTALGASTLSVHALDASSQQTEAGLSGRSTEGQGSMQIGVASTAGESRSLAFEAQLPGHPAQAVPDDIQWHKDEPLWLAIIEARRQNGMGRFALEVDYASDFGIDAGFFAEIQGVNLKLGGSRDTTIRRRWKIEGEFPGADAAVALGPHT